MATIPDMAIAKVRTLSEGDQDALGVILLSPAEEWPVHVDDLDDETRPRFLMVLSRPDAASSCLMSKCRRYGNASVCEATTGVFDPGRDEKTPRPSALQPIRRFRKMQRTACEELRLRRCFGLADKRPGGEMMPEFPKETGAGD